MYMSGSSEERTQLESNVKQEQLPSVVGTISEQNENNCVVLVFFLQIEE